MFPKYQSSEEKQNKTKQKVILRQMAIETEHIKTYKM